jgi:NTP pyrophosphatase (non-canonical NTP hydrolase)
MCILNLREREKMNQENKNLIKKFVDERDWSKFHSPSNLAKDISIESAELLEFFLWDNNNYDIEKVKEELADVLIYCEDLLNVLKLDEDKIVLDKMEKNISKYPLEKSKGKSDKYDKL